MWVLVSEAEGDSSTARKRPACETGEASSSASMEGEGLYCFCADTKDGGWVTLGCGHNFHHRCITKWVKEGTRELQEARSRCPLCRAPIVSIREPNRNGVRGREIPVPEMVDAVAEAEHHGTGLSYFHPRVHSAVTNALRTLQSELLGSAPANERRRAPQ